MSRRVQRRMPAWYTRPASRILFQHRLSACGLRLWPVSPPKRHRGGYALAVRLHVDDLPEQTIRIVFSPGTPEIPHVYTDIAAPASAPHRYHDGSLCMWFPSDPPGQRWTRPDGPVALLGHIVAHLLQEKWWCQTGEWPGQEAPHNRAEILSADAEPEIAA